ncbi:MAG: glycosyltransferase [Lachnospiraceae bacterium]|nr:glycosyltransferase [Lachnospiraceae bacterium]
MKTVVCMATYNGIKYIREQLESIRLQTISPDKVIIRDDASDDGTVDFIEKYIKDNGLANKWSLVKGEKNIGWKANFGEVLRIVMDEYDAEKTDRFRRGMINDDPEMLILLSDQDDIWLEDRVEQTIKIFHKNENMELLVGSFDFIDEKGNKTEFSKNTGIVLRQHFDGKFIHTAMPGAVYAVKPELLSDTKNYWRPELPHDAQLWIFAKMRHSLFTYDRAIISYRRHGETATGRGLTTEKSKLKDLSQEKEEIKLAMEYNKKSSILSRLETEILLRVEKYTLARERLLKRKSFPAAIQAMQYIDNYRSFRTFMGDIYFCIPEAFRFFKLKGKQF